MTSNAIKSLFKWIGFFFFLALLFFVFRFAISFTVVSGNSMNTTVHNNDILLSNHIFYTPESNDMIIFRDEGGFNVIKRIIGMPNETVEIKHGEVYINGHVTDQSFATGTPDDMEKVKIPGNSYFVMGDNRTPGQSLDSRSFGPVPAELIIGKVSFSVFPPSILK